MTFTAMDVYGFAGGFTLGMVQAGFELIGKREGPEGFGMDNCLANRHLLGEGWDAQCDWPTHWQPKKSDVVFGNPPCSGFSTFSPREFRGMDSPINKCMWNFAHFAGLCSPEIAVFESVQPAFNQGRPLMRALRDRIEEVSGKKYTLYHVLHNAASVGGAAIRRRYFFLVSRVPFGIEFPVIKAVPSFYEVIGDLLGMPMTWEEQPYRREPSWWAKKLRNPTGVVDGHTLAWNLSVGRILDVLKGAQWHVGETMVKAMERYYSLHGTLPESLGENAIAKYIGKNWEAGFQPKRWSFRKPAHVIMGSGPRVIIHPSEPRTLTIREVARTMGFNDDWTVKAAQGNKYGPAWFGKGITVQCGSWIGQHIKDALAGTPGSFPGTSLDDREFFIDVTNTYKVFPGAHRGDQRNE